MALTSDTLRLDEARRIALHAQGFNDPRPKGRIDRRHFRRVLDRVGLVQIDSVNVLTRSHELPFLARLGPYPRRGCRTGCGAAARCSSTGATRRRCCQWSCTRCCAGAWPTTTRGGRPDVSNVPSRARQAVLEAVRDNGPVTLGELEHLGDAIKRRPAAPGAMWNWTPAKKAVEWLFWNGEVSAVRNPQTFERHYARPDQVLPAAVLAAPTPPDDDARRRSSSAPPAATASARPGAWPTTTA